MSEAKWTPGPWEVKRGKWCDEDSRIVQAGMPSMRVLARFGSYEELLDETDIANAHLIAAAPELYEALKYARRFLSRLDHDVKFVDGALAKARGETND